tara:strand:+ start:28 stop:492 length:465 start_codon:yes stop_codon:yes gene_type:complete
MSFIGNIIGGYGADQIGKYNQNLYNQEAALKVQNAKLKKQTFLDVDKPRIIAQHTRDQSNMLVNFIKSGVDVSRIGDSPFLVMLDQTVEQAFDLEIAEFNSTVEFQNEMNNASLLRSKGAVEAYKGRITRNAEYAKAAGKMFANNQSSGSILTS